MKRVMILLKADERLSDPQIMTALNVTRPCVERIRKRFVPGGMEKTLNEDPRLEQRRKFDGRGEATLIATACSQVPEGHEHWTLRLLAGKMVELAKEERTIYRVKHDLLDDYLRSQLKSPSVLMRLA